MAASGVPSAAGSVSFQQGGAVRKASLRRVKIIFAGRDGAGGPRRWTAAEPYPGAVAKPRARYPGHGTSLALRDALLDLYELEAGRRTLRQCAAAPAGHNRG